jgi:hypothetical protein
VGWPGQRPPTAAGSQQAAAVLANGSISLGWTAVAGATGYNIYRSTTTTTEVFLASVGAVVVYVDNGTAVPTLVIPPVTDTTGGTAMTVVRAMYPGDATHIASWSVAREGRWM